MVSILVKQFIKKLQVLLTKVLFSQTKKTLGKKIRKYSLLLCLVNDDCKKVVLTDDIAYDANLKTESPGPVCSIG